VPWPCTKRGGRPLGRLGDGNNGESEDLLWLLGEQVHQVAEPIA
jgi:hypothetical protein